jgi:hypothetical protein
MGDKSGLFHAFIDLPLGKQLLADLIAPPCLVMLWWIMGKTRAFAGKTSQESKSGIDTQSAFLLVLFYVLMFALTMYSYFSK